MDKPKILFLVVVLVLMATAGTLFFVKKSQQPKTISFSTGTTLVIPDNWSVFKKPLRDMVILKSSQKEKDNACYASIFVVKPDKDYAFKQWLETALTNQVFLAKGRETTYKDKSIFMGSYDFYNDNFDQIVKNQRVLLKDKGIMFDMQMGYKNNDCSQDFYKILDSVVF